jgi:ABC-type glycerol-3-phosphate transport system permease component
MCAALTVALTPVLIMTIFLRRHIIRGFTLGFLK